MMPIKAPCSSADPLDGQAWRRNHSRRQALRQVSGGVAGAWLTLATPACARSEPQSETDDQLLQRLIASPTARIPAREAPYRLTRSLALPAGSRVILAEGVRLAWHGPVGSVTSLTGVFVAAGSDVHIVAEGNGAFVECDRPSPFVYAALMRGFSGFEVVRLHARECQHVHVNATTDDYTSVKLDGPDANAARNVRIIGGGASYAVPQTTGHGACFLHFARGCDVRDAKYRNVANGVQWWGGNADPVRPPANGGADNERKCRDIVIANVTAETVFGAGIWGAMGSDITVRDCQIAEIGDVGFDAEGCNRVTFERCVARNAHNGCFATFFLCNGVRFIDCTGIVDNKAFPLVRVYNESQTNNDNTGLEIIGGTFECRDHTGASTIDTATGPVGTLRIEGATLKNVRIDLAHSNMHRTMIVRNTLDFPYPLGAGAAISAGSSKSLQRAPQVVPGAVTIADNVIRYHADPSSKATAIELREDDFNSSANDQVQRNRISGPFAIGVALTSASTNAGIVPSFALTSNRFENLAADAALLVVTRTNANAREPAVRWDATQSRDGQPVSLSSALHRGPFLRANTRKR